MWFDFSNHCKAIRINHCRGESLGKLDNAGHPDRQSDLDAAALLDMTESSYIELVQWTDEQLHPMKRGKLIPRSDQGEKPPKVVLKLSNHSDRWLRQVRGTESKYYRAIGSAEALMAKAAELGQRWMQGVSGERAWMIIRSQTE